jgi:hypothetical protein
LQMVSPSAAPSGASARNPRTRSLLASLIDLQS